MPPDNNLPPPRLPIADGFERGIAQIRQFCQDFSEREIQSSLSTALKACVTSETPDFEDAEDRQDIYHVFENLAELINAVCLLNSVSHLAIQRF